MEIGSEKKTLQETVQKAVEAALRQQNKPAGKTKSRSNKVLPPQKYSPTASNSSLGKRKEPCRDEACLYPEQTLRHKESQVLQKRRKAETPIERTRIGPFPEEREEGQGKLDIIRSARWSVNNPSSSVIHSIFILDRRQCFRQCSDRHLISPFVQSISGLCSTSHDMGR